MTTLNSLSETFKKFLWLIPFLILIIFFTLVLIIKSVPKKPSIPKIDKPNLSIAAQISSNFDVSNLEKPTDIPKELPVYNLSSMVSFLDKAQKISQNLGFTNPPEKTSDIDLGEGLTYTNDNPLLINNHDILNIYPQSINLAKSALKNNSQKLSLEELKTKASAYLENTGIKIIPEALSTTYLKISQHDTIEVTDPNQATYVNFSFYPKLQQYPVVASGYKNNIGINFQGDVLSMTLRNFKAEPQNQQYPINSYDDALNLLQSGHATIINITEPENTISQNLDVSLQIAYLAYYPSQDNSNSVQPVWIFEGESKTTSGVVKTIYAIPAISSQYLKPNPKP